jgi:hypothetical protein
VGVGVALEGLATGESTAEGTTVAVVAVGARGAGVTSCGGGKALESSPLGDLCELQAPTSVRQARASKAGVRDMERSFRRRECCPLRRRAGLTQAQ